MSIEEYDGKWSAPLLMWQALGLLMGNGITRLLAGFILGCWLYLWVLLIKEVKSLSFKTIMPFASLFIFALYQATGMIGAYLVKGDFNARVLPFVVPFIAFCINSVILFKRVKSNAQPISKPQSFA